MNIVRAQVMPLLGVLLYWACAACFGRPMSLSDLQKRPGPSDVTLDGARGWVHAGSQLPNGVRSVGLQGSAAAAVTAFVVSPDGTKLAEVVRPLGSEAEVRQIVVLELHGQPRRRRVIYSGKSVTSLQWMNNRKIMFIRHGTNTQIIAESVSSGEQRVLFQRAGGIDSILYDRQSQRFAIQYSKPWMWGSRVSVKMTDDMEVVQLLEPRWARFAQTSVAARQLISGDSERTDPIALRFHGFTQSIWPPQLAWRHGRLLILQHLPGSRYNSRRIDAIVDAQSGQPIGRRAPLFHITGMAISAAGRIAVTGLWRYSAKPAFGGLGQEYVAVLGQGGQAYRISALSAEQHVVYIAGLWWAGRDRLFVQLVSAQRSNVNGFDGVWRASLQEVNWRTDRVLKVYRWPDGDLGGDLGAMSSQCSLDADRNEAVCVAQTLTDPPRLVEIDLRSGRMDELGKLNPEQRPLSFRFRRVKVRDRFGGVSTGLLALPATARDHRVPLAVMLYGFGDSYSRYAQWITSYPVAGFVHSGIAVLLLNWAFDPGDEASLEKEQSFWQAKHTLESDVSLIANALPAVRATGVRVNRAMIMGWSFGGLFVAHAMQDLDEYVAAQVGDPATYNTTAYALGNAEWRAISDWTFGGPPTRKNISHYLDFDPAADGHPSSGPILLEFVSRNLDAGQYLEEWRALGTEVEAFAYRHSIHSLNVPSEARISRMRNLYWAKMNLFGPQSVTCEQLRSVGLSVPKTGWWSKELQLGKERSCQGN